MWQSLIDGTILSKTLEKGELTSSIKPQPNSLATPSLPQTRTRGRARATQRTRGNCLIGGPAHAGRDPLYAKPGERRPRLETALATLIHRVAWFTRWG